jgi:cell division septum initiation protein DivIVA
MLMTQTELNNLLGQVNQAFKEQGDKITHLQKRLDSLEEKVNAQEKRPKAGTRGRKRVQQAETNTEPPNEEVCSGGEAGGQNQNY